MRTLLYRFFSAPLTIIFAGLLLFAAPTPASAQDDPSYTAKNISVDISGSSAIDARKKAFAEARRKAYQQVAATLVPADQAANVVIPEDRVIEGMVRDFEIIREKMTTRRYAGTMDIRFVPAALKRSVQVAAATPAADTATDNTANTGAQADSKPVTDAAIEPVAAVSGDGQDYVYSPARKAAVGVGGKATDAVARAETKTSPVLVLPWYGPVGRQTLWGQTNPWRDAWEADAALARDKAMPVVLPVGDVDDLRDYSPPQPLSRRGNVGQLLKRYGAGQAVLAVAEETAQGIVVSLYQMVAGNPVAMGRFGVDGGDSKKAMADAVRKAAASIRAMPALADTAVTPTNVSVTSDAQPVAPAVVAPADGAYRALARFSGLQQWVALRQALGRVPGIGPVSIRAISPSQASVEFQYGGNPQGLAALMAQNGLSMQPAPEGVTGAGAPAQFTLSMARSY